MGVKSECITIGLFTLWLRISDANQEFLEETAHVLESEDLLEENHKLLTFKLDTRFELETET